MDEPSEIDAILARLRDREEGAKEDLLRLAFHELHELARSMMKAQGPGHTLQASVLVSEAYLRLFRGTQVSFQDKRHLMFAAATAMRCVLLDHARKKNSLRRGAGAARVPLDDLAEQFDEHAGGLEGLDAALDRLARIDPRGAKIVELKFFGGRTDDEVAELLEVSKRTVERDWNVARAWLRRELG